MPLRVLHTGDLHLGMKFRKYPDEVKEKLIEARFKALDTLVEMANDHQCNMMVIAGDLFDKTNVPRRDIERAANSLKRFSGDCVLVLPGNHDFDNGSVDLWNRFQDVIAGDTVLLNECRPYSLQEFNLDVTVYPAPCDAKHSSENRLGWIKDAPRKKSGLEIGIAHGALAGISPDMNEDYYNMEEQELAELGLDLWLLGHTHIPYPEPGEVINRRIFNSGTPEPDGLDCSHGGYAWLIDLDDEKTVKARALEVGFYRFYDLTRRVESEDDFQAIARELASGNLNRKIVRLHLEGRLEEGVYSEKEDFYQELRNQLAYLEIDDSELGVRITPARIDQEFSANSFPHRLLTELADKEEDHALQMAYELIKEVRQK